MHLDRPVLRSLFCPLAMSVLPPLFLAAPAALGQVDPLTWAPDDAVVYIATPDSKALMEAVKGSAGWTQMKMILQDVGEDASAAAFDHLRDYLVTWFKLDGPKALEVYPQGAAAAWIRIKAPNGDAEEPDLFFSAALDMGERMGDAKKLTDRFIDRMKEQGARAEEKSVAGMEMVVLNLEGMRETRIDPKFVELLEEVVKSMIPDEQAAEMMTQMGPLSFEDIEWSGRLIIGRAENRLLFSNDAADSEMTARRLKDASMASLARTDVQALLKRHALPGAQFIFAFNVPTLIGEINKEDENVRKTTTAMGLTGIGPIVGALTYTPSDELESKGTIFASFKGEAKGLARIVADMKNQPLVPPAIIPEGTAVWGRANIDFGRVMEVVSEIVRAIDPQQGQLMDASMKVPTPSGEILDLRKDVFDHLKGPIQGLITAEQPYGNAQVNTVLAVGHDSRAAIDKLITALPPGMLTPTDMLGSTVFQVMMVPIPGLALGVSNGHLIPLATKAGVEAFLRAEGREGGGLSEDPAFRETARHLPREAAMVFWQNTPRLFEAQLAIAKSGDFKPGAMDPGMVFGQDFGYLVRMMLHQQFPGAAMKDPEKLRPYQAPAMMTVTTSAEGAKMEFVHLKARGAKP